MTLFFSAHGTNPNIFDGQFQDLDFGIADDVASDDHREVSKWASVEELAMYDPFNEETEEEDFNIFSFDYEPWLEFVFEDEDDRPGVAILCDGTRIILEFDELELNETIGLRPLDRFADEDPDQNKMPSFSSNRDKRILNWSEADYRWWRYYRNCKDRKPAQFRVDGKLVRKDSPRWSIRHIQVEMSDWYHLEYHGEHDYVFEEWSTKAVPTFDIEVVGLTEDEASYYEAEFERECAYHRIEYVECSSDNSNVFDPITNAKMVQEVWEHHLFPERFVEYRPYRFSDYDWYDDFDYYDQFYDPNDDYDADSYYDDGPTIEEWTAIDQLEIERLLEEEADNYFPSFGSSFPKRKVHGYNVDAKHGFARSKAHTADRGWRRFAPKKRHGRDSIRTIPIWEMHRYTAMDYLTDNARVN